MPSNLEATVDSRVSVNPAERQNSVAEGAGSRRSLLLNSSALLTGRLLTVLASFLTIPFAVKVLGMRGYGTWETLFAIGTASNLFQSSIGATLVWKMSTAYALGDKNEVVRLMRVGIWIVLAIVIVFTPVIFFWRSAIVARMNIPAEYAREATDILPFLCLLILAAAANETFAAAITASQRVGLANLLQSSGLILNSIVTVATLRMNWGLHSLVAGQLAGLLFCSISLYAAIISSYGLAGPTPTRPTIKDLKAMSPYFGFLLMGSASIILRDQTDKLILAAAKDPEWVAYYGIAIRLASPILLVCGFFYVPLFSAVAALSARNERAKIVELYETTSATVSLLAGAMAVLLAVLHDRILILWIGREVPQVTTLLYILLLANVTAVYLTGTGSALCKGIGRPAIEAIYVCVAVAVNLLLKAFLVIKIGGIGTVVASGISWVVGALVFMVAFQKTVRMPMRTTIRSGASMAAIVVAIAVSHYCSPRPGAGQGTAELLLECLQVGGGAFSVFLVLFLASNTLLGLHLNPKGAAHAGEPGV